MNHTIFCVKCQPIFSHKCGTSCHKLKSKRYSAHSVRHTHIIPNTRCARRYHIRYSLWSDTQICTFGRICWRKFCLLLAGNGHCANCNGRHAIFNGGWHGFPCNDNCGKFGLITGNHKFVQL